MATSSSRKKRQSPQSTEESPPKRGRSSTPVLGDIDGNAGSPAEEVDNIMEEEDIKPQRQELASPRQPINRPGKPPEAGVIKRVYVENFMCHAKLSVELCRNVNFIHGQNGSGKSAVLAAIQICLGASARRTNRARNLKGLIRNDVGSGAAPSCAKIRVTLLNQGSDGFKPEIYGDEITIERTIANGGGFNGFKMYGADKAEKSRDKKELNDILDALNIQVDNPVAVLDQEESKKFLTGQPSDKYKFFLKASELERVDRKYGETKDTLDEMLQSHIKVRESLRPAEERLDRLKQKWKEHQALEKLEYKLQELKVGFAWALHGDAEADYAGKSNTAMAVQEKLEEKEKQLKEFEETHCGKGDLTQEKTQHVKDVSHKAATQTKLQQKLQKDLKELVIPQKQMRRRLETLKTEKKKARRDLVAAQKKLDDRLAEIAQKTGSADSENARRREELKVVEEKLHRASERVKELNETLEDCHRAYEAAEANVQTSRQVVKNASSQLEQAQRNLVRLESAGSNSMGVFGRKVAAVHGMVERARSDGRFRGPVVGPIGSYLKLNPGKEQYRNIVEVALGNGVFDAFIVTTEQDLNILQAIRRKADCQQDCGVYKISVTPRHRVPGPPVDGIETAATILKIENDLVFNCLVDQKQIEKMAFGPSKQSSQDKLLVQDGNGRHAVRGKIKQVYFLPKGDMWSVRAGQISLASITRKPRGLLSEDKTEAIVAARHDQDTCEDELRQAEEEDNRNEGEHTKLCKAWNEADKAKKANDKKIEELSDAIQKLKMEIEDASSDDVYDTSGEQEAVDSAKENEADLMQQIEEATKTLEDNEPAIQDLKGKVDEAGIEAEKCQAELRAAEDDAILYAQTQSQQSNVLQKKRDKVEKLREKLGEFQEAAAKAQTNEEDALLKARKIQYIFTVYKEQRQSDADGDGAIQDDVPNPTEEELESISPVTVGKDSEYFESRIDRTMQKLEHERERNQLLDQTKEEALQAYQTAKEELGTQQQSVKQLSEKIKNLRADLNDRKTRWLQFRTYIQEKTVIKFAEMLDMNDFEGDLEFDDEEKTLDLCVSKKGKGKAQTKDMKALSGGERSYTTVCLLLALGETLETPFRILDEFDVFLDTQVRKMTIQALIHLAIKEMSHRQFIFITPQDLSGIDPGPQLKILKLRPPVRHSQQAGGASQTTLNFSQN